MENPDKPPAMLSDGRLWRVDQVPRHCKMLVGAALFLLAPDLIRYSQFCICLSPAL